MTSYAYAHLHAPQAIYLIPIHAIRPWQFQLAQMANLNHRIQTRPQLLCIYQHEYLLFLDIRPLQPNLVGVFFMSHRHQIQGVRIPNMATHHINTTLRPAQGYKKCVALATQLIKKRIGFLFFIATFFGGFFCRARPGFYRLFRVFL